MDLKEYERKRNFEATPEPAPHDPEKPAHRNCYVIQKHAATRLHYDLRLQIGNALKSWAVPKGPSLDPRESRLALEVEDHPLSYAEFEGTIPAGNYGAGAVIVWDSGHWKPIGDARSGLRRGKLAFQLFGEKLKGTWILLRMNGSHGDKPQWLLKKQIDEYAKDDSGTDICEARPESVKSGRILEDIPSGKTPKHKTYKPISRTALLKGLRLKKLATTEAIAAELPSSVSSPPTGEAWLHEMKLDGYRLGARISSAEVTLLTRNLLDWSHRFPTLVADLRTLQLRDAYLDGEIVVFDSDGRSSFQGLQRWLKTGEGELRYVVFDLLALEGKDLRPLTLSQRKSLLHQVLSAQSDSLIQRSEYIIGQGPEVYRQACALGIEGIVSKKIESAYRSGRSKNWLKTKCRKEAEFVVGGYTVKPQRPNTVSALLVGYYNEDRALVSAGKVGSGFTTETGRDVLELLRKLKQTKPSFHKPPSLKHSNWTKPQMVVQVEFTEITADGSLRHPVFKGIREDKPAEQVQTPIELKTELPPPPPEAEKPSRVDLDALLSHPDKILYQKQSISKRQLAEYYLKVADWVLPEISNRPLVLVRCPQGSSRKCFFHKHVDDAQAAHLPRVLIQEKDGPNEYLYVTQITELIHLVQLNTLEIHVWPSRVTDVEHPDRMVFDLDPGPDVSARRVVDAAVELRRLLSQLDLESYVRTTGGKGLHVVVPISPQQTAEQVKEFAEAVAKLMVEQDSKLYTAVLSKRARAGKIYIDFLRNGRGQTAVASYSTRARDGAPVSVPLNWEELPALKRFNAWTLENIMRRLGRLRENPWQGINENKQALPVFNSP